MVGQQECPTQKDKVAAKKQRICWRQTLHLYVFSVDTLRRFPKSSTFLSHSSRTFGCVTSSSLAGSSPAILRDTQCYLFIPGRLNTTSQSKWAIRSLKPDIVTNIKKKNSTHVWKIDCLGRWPEAGESRESRESREKCTWEEGGLKAYWKLRCLWGKGNQYGLWIF